MSDFMLSVPRELLSLSGDATAAFLEMYRRLMTSKFESQYVSDASIAYTLFDGDEKRAKVAMEKIAVLGYAERQNGAVVVHRDNMYYPSYILIGLKEYYNIIASDERADKRVALLHHFCCVICSFSWTIEVNGEVNVVGSVPISYFEKREKKSAKTIKRYNDILHEMGMITVFSGSKYNPKENARHCNYYCRTSNATAVKQYIDKVNGIQSQDLSNFRRTATAKYNQYVKTPDRYTSDEALEILCECAKYWDLKKDKGRREKLSIFVDRGVVEEVRLKEVIDKMTA